MAVPKKKSLKNTIHIYVYKIQRMSVTIMYIGFPSRGLLPFVMLDSARTTLGHDAEGRIIMVEIDGKSYQRFI